MPIEEKRTLTEDEKQTLLSKHSICYICLEPLEGYERSEIQFDHIYSYADGYSQELANFAPVHASTKENKLNCHSAKGRKSPAEYREELRIKKKLRDVKGLGFPRFRGQCNMPLRHRVAPIFGRCPDTTPPQKIALRAAMRLAFPRCLLSDLIRPPVRRLSAQTHAA